MARVVSQRTNPPYLLIIVVFLFLIATTLAILQYLERDRAQQRVVELDNLLTKFATPQERREGKMMDLIKEHDRGKGRRTVVSQLTDRTDKLAQAITGMPSTFDEAVGKVDEVAERIRRRRGLVVEVLDAHILLAKAGERIEDLEKQLRANREEIKKTAALATTILQSQKAQTGQFKNQVAELEAKFQSEHQDHLNQLAQAKKQWQQTRGELTKQVATKTLQIQDLELENRQLEIKLAKAQRRGHDDGQGAGAISATGRPDGKIMKVMDQADICYINIGSKDRVRAGLTFSVYPAGDIPETGQGKAKLVVTNVSENISECRIVKQDKDDPIVTGDIIANLAFDSLRTYSFVVEGDFDLQDTGRPSLAGTEEVKALIKRFGGKVDDDVDIQTDFVVMGVEPARPPRPAESAPPTVWAAYQEQMKIYERYRSVKSLAQGLNIPALNTNRFLAFVGYSPIRTLGR